MANNKNQKTKNYVAAAMGIAAGAMIYKKTHTACGQCGSKISGKQYKINLMVRMSGLQRVWLE